MEGEQGEQENDGMATLEDASGMIDSLTVGVTLPPSLQPPVQLHHFYAGYWPVADQFYENSASVMIALSELNNEINVSHPSLHNIYSGKLQS